MYHPMTKNLYFQQRTINVTVIKGDIYKSLINPGNPKTMGTPLSSISLYALLAFASEYSSDI